MHIQPIASAVLAAILLPFCVHAAELQVDIQGLEEDMGEAARARLTLAEYEGKEIPPARLRVLLRNADTEIREALEPFGFYNATVESDVQRSGEGVVRALLKVDAGQPTLVSDSSVVVLGAGAEIPEVRAAVQAFEPAKGQQLDHQAYEASKGAIGAALRDAGFLRALTSKHQVTVRPENNAAQIDLEWRSGERYRFGDVVFRNTGQFSEEFLRPYIPWRPGDYYSTEQLLAFQQRLASEQYFSIVSVEPNIDEAKDGEVPIEVLVREDERTAYTGEVFYSTDFGAGVRVGVERRWLNSRGHKADAGIEYSQRLQEIATSYTIPRPGRNKRSYRFGAGYRDEETDTTRSRATRLAAADSRQGWKGFTRTIGLQLHRGNFEIAEAQGDSTVLFAEGVLGRRRVDAIAYPRRGYAVDFGVRFAAEGVASDTDMAQAWARGSLLIPSGENARFKLRAELGAMGVGDFDALPPELRFFAGGDRSLRGFDYRAIGEQNETGGVIGGEYLAIGSIEYEHFFHEEWGAAVFVDAGDAFISDFNANVSPGVGIRWRSPFGMVRIDVARPVKTHFEKGWRVHLLIGPDI